MAADEASDVTKALAALGRPLSGTTALPSRSSRPSSVVLAGPGACRACGGVRAGAAPQPAALSAPGKLTPPPLAPRMHAAPSASAQPAGTAGDSVGAGTGAWRRRPGRSPNGRRRRPRCRRRPPSTLFVSPSPAPAVAHLACCRASAGRCRYRPRRRSPPFRSRRHRRRPHLLHHRRLQLWRPCVRRRRCRSLLPCMCRRVQCRSLARNNLADVFLFLAEGPEATASSQRGLPEMFRRV